MSKNIVLIGMPGCGKSTIGYILSKQLNMGFIDMDKYIELNEKKSIKEMFMIGEDYFRDIETKYSAIISKFNSYIIATGGGIVKRHENIKYLKENSIIVFINRPIENIINDIDADIRPLLSNGKEKLYQLFNERIDLYKKYSDIEIYNNDEITEIINMIEKKIKGCDMIENNCN